MTQAQPTPVATEQPNQITPDEILAAARLKMDSMSNALTIVVNALVQIQGQVSNLDKVFSVIEAGLKKLDEKEKEGEKEVVPTSVTKPATQLETQEPQPVIKGSQWFVDAFGHYNLTEKYGVFEHYNEDLNKYDIARVAQWKSGIYGVDDPVIRVVARAHVFHYQKSISKIRVWEHKAGRFTELDFDDDKAVSFARHLEIRLDLTTALKDLQDEIDRTL